MLAEIPADEFAAVIDTCAAEVLWEASVIQPPVDAVAVAEAIGLVVTHNDSLPHRGHFVRLAGQRDSGAQAGTIVVSRAERPEREQWAVAHEIGESVAHRVFQRLGGEFVDASTNGRELVANRLANAILLPRAWFNADGRQFDWDLFGLKAHYSTASHELIARRMLEMRQPIVITICDQGRVFWRRCNLTSRAPAMLSEEKSVWQQAHTTGSFASRTLDSEAGLASIRVWPVHEPDWKREIMRSEVAEI